MIYNKDMKPDFLIIPLILQQDENIRPSDLITYGVVYWFEHLKDGECRASNETIGEVAGIDTRTVNAGLTRLERAGYINRFYKDEQNRNRDRIECNVAYKYSKTEKKQVPRALATDNETPGHYAKRFFTGDEVAVKECVAQLVAHSNGQGEEAIKVEMRKFYSYWTEPNKSGTRQRWELQRTFDVKRRLYTWLSRVSVKSKGAGAGIVI